MQSVLIANICKEAINYIFSKLPSLKLKVTEHIERTDEGDLRIIDIEFKVEEDQEF